MQIELMSRKQVAAALSVSVKTLLRRVARGEFPPPALILGMERWRKEDVLSYVEKQFSKAKITELSARLTENRE